MDQRQQDELEARLPVGIRIGKELAMANRRIDPHVAEQGGKRVAVPCLPKREKIDAPELPAELLADLRAGEPEAHPEQTCAFRDEGFRQE